MMEYRAPEDALGHERARDAAARRLRFGAGGFGAVVVLLAFAPPLPFRDAIGFGLFYALVPALGWAQLPLLPVTPIDRAAVYAGSAASLVMIAAVALLLGLAPRDGGGSVFPAVWGLSAGSVVAWTVALVIGGLGVIVAFEPLDRSIPSGGPPLVKELLPRTGEEKMGFVGLSLVAGVGEEVAYRGYALSAIGLLVGSSWVAAAASTLPFAALHAYQGPVGVARTAVVGFALAASVVVSGSLLPAILAHASIDILAGLVVGPWLLARASRGG